MKPYVIVNKDCLDAMKQIPDNCIDSVCTDPPYGLSKQPDIAEVMQHWLNDKTYEHKSVGFCGAKWDSFVPGPEYWREVYRVLKPGGHAAIFAGSRTQDLMSIALRFAGFEIRETVMWVYSQGFPKSHDVSKAIDKIGGVDTEKFKSDLSTLVELSGKSRQQIDSECGFTMRFDTQYDKDPIGWGVSMPSPEKWLKICEVLNADPTKWSDLINRVWRGKAGEAINASKRSFGEEYERTYKGDPVFDQAKQWQGWGTALKPAYEPIILVRKPLEGTVAQNVLKWGVGGINIDECRVELANEVDKAQFEFNHAVGTRLPEEYADKKLGLHDGGWMQQVGEKETPTGRWPANLCHDGSDEVVEMFPESGSGNGKGAYNYAGREYDNKDTSMFNGDKPQAPSNYNETGSAARFFYSSKATKKDRGEGNIHPTVKPVKLMEWLVKMITPTNGKCLDPFMGSGTTGLACLNTKRRFIGMELDKSYFEIARQRIVGV